METHQRITDFIEGWPDSSSDICKGFKSLKDLLSSFDDVELDFVEREGVTYSLRARHAQQRDRPLFVMVDVIEDRPRWLSVCFYGDMASDQDGHGDFVPGGLLGEDGLCFDMDEYSAEMVEYISERIIEAKNSAAHS